MLTVPLAPAATVHAIPGLHMLCKYGIYDAHGAYLVQLYYYQCTVYMMYTLDHFKNGSSSHYIQEFCMYVCMYMMELYMTMTCN